MDEVITAAILLVLILGLTVTGYTQEVVPSVSLRHHQTLQASMLLQLSDQAYLLGVASAKKEEQRSEELSLSRGMITKEILAGGGLGAALSMTGGVIGFKIADAVWPPEGEHGAWMTMEEFACGSVGLVGGFIFGSAIGVYLVGTGGNVTGSFSRALLGSIIGICIPVPLFGPAIGAAIVFNPTRRHKLPPAELEIALINARDGQMSLAVPRVYSRADPFGRGNLSQSVDLLRMRF